jgi:WD40 repeat protein
LVPFPAKVNQSPWMCGMADMKILWQLSALVMICMPALDALADQGPPRTEQAGDPLPKGALLRLGSLRYCQNTAIAAVAFAPDGKTYATAANAPKDCSVRLWNTATGEQLQRWSMAPQPILQLAFAPDGKTIAVACGCDFVVLDAGTAKVLRRFEGHPGGISCFAWSPDGKALAVGGELYRGDPVHTIRLVDATAGKLLQTFDKHYTRVNVVAFSADGKRLGSSSTDRVIVNGNEIDVTMGQICIWDTGTGKKLHQLQERPVFAGRGDFLKNAAFSADLARVAFRGPKHELQVWDIALGKKLCGVEAPNRTFGLSADGKSLVVGGEENTIGLWDATTGKLIRNFVGHGGHGRHIAGMDPAGKYLATTSADTDVGLLRLWDMATGKELTGADGHVDTITFAQATPDGKLIISAGRDGTVRLWDRSTGRPIKVLTGFTGWQGNVALAASGKTLAFIDLPGAVQVLELPGCKPLSQLEKSHAWGSSVVLSPDGKLLGVARMDTRMQGEAAVVSISLYLADAKSGKKLVDFPGKDWRPLAFSPDSQLFATGDRGIYVYDAHTGKKLLTFQVPGAEFNPNREENAGTTNYWDIAFSPDGRWLARSETFARKGKSESKLGIWEVATGQLVLDVADPTYNASGFAFAPDSLTLVTWSTGREEAATFWDLTNGKLLGHVGGHLGSVTSVGFAPDGSLLTGGTDGTVEVWDRATLPRAKLPPPRKPGQAELAELWQVLASSDARKAYQAIVTLTAGGTDSVAVLQFRLKPAKLLPAAQLAKLVADLDNKSYAVRAKAFTILETQGALAAKELRKVIKDDMTLEMRRRVELLLGKLESFTPPPPELRDLRALAVLERIADDQARQLIEQLAEGSPEARLTQQARAALGRLKQRAAPAP